MFRSTFVLINVLKIKFNYVHKIQLNNCRNCCAISIRNFSQNTKLKCWSCGVEKKTSDLFCNSCKIIQEPNVTDNYFQLLGINETYNVDLKNLTQKYRKLQSQLHPDKYSNKSDKEKQISEEYSSIVNSAYNTLQSPIQRGLHLLSLKGENINENDKNADKMFLMEIMELNEEVEQAATPNELLELNRKNRQQLDIITTDLNKAFDSGDIQAAKKLIIRMKYFVSISNQINHILRERGVVE